MLEAATDINTKRLMSMLGAATDIKTNVHAGRSHRHQYADINTKKTNAHAGRSHRH
jgi:hypothetical protein